MTCADLHREARPQLRAQRRLRQGSLHPLDSLCLQTLVRICRGVRCNRHPRRAVPGVPCTGPEGKSRKEWVKLAGCGNCGRVRRDSEGVGDFGVGDR
eukprot:64-Rhodomonas_salina.1